MPTTILFSPPTTVPSLEGEGKYPTLSFSDPHSHSGPQALPGLHFRQHPLPATARCLACMVVALSAWGIRAPADRGTVRVNWQCEYSQIRQQVWPWPEQVALCSRGRREGTGSTPHRKTYFRKPSLSTSTLILTVPLAKPPSFIFPSVCSLLGNDPASSAARLEPPPCWGMMTY